MYVHAWNCVIGQIYVLFWIDGVKNISLGSWKSVISGELLKGDYQ